tara:strand:+ start:1739 stop:2335 length:597 start_codon:yes stop_codon:yes gene_type:complete
LDSICAGPLPVADRLELRRLVDALCHASRVTDESLPNTSRVDTAVAALKRFKANLKRRSDAKDGLTSKRLMDLPEDARSILLSSIAFTFRDEVDEWSEIDFGNETHVEMLEASVTSSLAKLTNPQGRPVNEALDVFFLGLRDFYQKTTGKEAVAGAHHDGKPHSDFETLMNLGYQLIRPANSYATALKAWERALERAR